MRNVCTFLALVFSFGIQAQWSIKRDTDYGFVSAKHNEETLEDYHLKGPVQEMIVLSADSKDSLIYKYSETGKLLSLRHFNDPNSDRFKRQTWIYRNDSLVGIETIYGTPDRSKGDLRRELKRFRNGYLINLQGHYQTKTEGDISKITVNYDYNESKDKASLEYNYKGQNENRYLPRKGRLEFVFDESGKLSRERTWTDYGESSGGANTTFNYHSAHSKPTHVIHRADCAGGNSCRDTELMIKYNDSGLVIHEELTDHTIRNALWSYSYTKSFKYNQNGELVASHESNNDNGSTPISISSAGVIEEIPTTNKLPETDQYRYDYDENGNWIRKWGINITGDKLVSSREITYF